MSKINKEVEELTHKGITMQFDISKIVHDVEELKKFTTTSLLDLQKQFVAEDTMHESRIKKLEEQTEALTKSIEGLRHNSSSLTYSPGSDSTTATVDRYRLDPSLQSQNPRTSNYQQYRYSEMVSPKQEDGNNRMQQIPWSQSANLGSMYSSPDRVKKHFEIIN